MNRLIGLLHQVAQYSAYNKMTPSNLAIVFAPTLYRPKDETFEVVIQDSGHANTLIETFITLYQELFQVH